MCPFTRLVFITNPKTQHYLINIFGFKYIGIPVEYHKQKYDTHRNRPWGTTDAVCTLHGVINEACIIVNGDDLYGVESFKKGFDLLNHSNNDIIGGSRLIDTLPTKGYVNRGIIQLEGDYVSSMKECMKISKENNPELHHAWANVNFIGVHPSTITKLRKILDAFKEKHKDDKDIECLLPDCLSELLTDIKIKFFFITERVVGLTNPDDESIVRNFINTISA